MKAEISVKETHWSGFSGQVTEKDPAQTEVQEGDNILPPEARYSLQVQSIREGEIDLFTENLAIQEEGKKGTNLHPKPSAVTIQKGSSQKFATPTMDSGTSWVITLLSTKD